MKNLDDCAVLYLQNGKLGSEKVNGLDNGLKFKSAYLKKNPMRSESLKKKWTVEVIGLILDMCSSGEMNNPHWNS